jgi:hypothetical protein
MLCRYTINTEPLIDAGKEVGLEINTELSICCSTTECKAKSSNHQNVAQLKCL